MNENQLLSLRSLLHNIAYSVYVTQWRAVTSETGHAIGMPKSGHAIGYFMSMSKICNILVVEKKFCVRF